MTDPLLFGLAVLAVLAVPGPTNTLLMTSGATVGARRSLPLLLAEASGYILGILVVSPLASAQPAGRAMLGGAVGLYLLMVATKLWRHGPRSLERPVTWRSVFVTTLLNPKVLVFALLVVPMTAPHPERYLAAFCAIVMPVGASWIMFGAFAGHLAGDRRLSLVPRVAAVVMVGLAFLLIGNSLSLYLRASAL